MNDWSSLFGIRVKESPYVEPVAKIRFNWPDETPKIREFNDWLKARFGTVEVAYMIDMGAAGLFGGQMMVMNPRMMTMLRQVAERGGE